MSLLHGLHVLVVGERGGVAESIASPLRADGHLVGDAPDGAAAVAAARVHLPDVVLLDANLPGQDVRTIAAEIGGLSVWRRPFFIALTRNQAKNPIPECPPVRREADIDIYLSEPSAAAHVRGLLRRFQSVVSDYESFDPVI
jgi:CheY-like chemotaxis protein